MLLEDHLAGAIGADLAVEHELAHLQRREPFEDRDVAAQELQPFGDAALLGQAGEFGGEDRLVGWFQLAIAVDELDDVIALVHAMFDQRIAGERADHENPPRGAFEHRGQPRKGEPVAAGEFDPARFDEAARRGRAHARDQPIAFQLHLPIARIERDLPRFDLRGGAFGEQCDAPRLARGHQRLDVGGLGAGEFGRAVDERDDIALRLVRGEPQRILDPGVAAADHEDMLVIIRGGIVELILDVRQIGARAAHQIGVALRADRQDHRIGDDLAPVGQRQAIGRREPLDFARLAGPVALALDDLVDAAGDRLAGAGNRLHFGMISDLDPLSGGLFVPAPEDRLALARVEIEIGSQHELARRRHHMLALLILVDRIRKVVGLFEQQVRQPQLGGARGGAQPRRPRSDDRDAHALTQRSVPPICSHASGSFPIECGPVRRSIILIALG